MAQRHSHDTQYGTTQLVKRMTRRDTMRMGISGLTTLLLSAAAGAGTVPAAASTSHLIQFPRNPKKLTPFERLHIPKIRMPDVIEDGANAPIIVEMDHPMDLNHYVTNIQILNYHDPIVWKGTFHYTPDNGRVYLYSQLRIDSGKSLVYVIAECNQHGKWVNVHLVDVAVGGC